MIDALKPGVAEKPINPLIHTKHLEFLATCPYNFGTTTATGLYVSELPNPKQLQF